MGREVGGGIGMGKTCEPKAFSFQCMTKFTTKKKKKKKNQNFIKSVSSVGRLQALAAFKSQHLGSSPSLR